MMHPASSKTPHRIYLAAVMVLPLFFLLSLASPFILAKDVLLIILSGLLGISLVLWCGKRAETVVVLKRSALYLIAFLGYAFISILWAPSTAGAVRSFLPLMAGALFFLGFDMYYRNEDAENRFQIELIQAVVITALLQSGVVLIQFFGFGLSFYEGLEGKWRVFGTFGNPNYVAEFLLPAVFLSLNLFLNENRKLQRRFYMLAFLVTSLAVFATFSRTGLLLWFLGLFAYLLFYSSRDTGGLRAVFAAAFRHGKSMIAFLATGLILIYIIVPVFRFDQTLMRHVANKTSMLGRIFIWKNSVAATVANLPLGAGLGGFPAAYAAAQYDHFKDSSSFIDNGRLVIYAHNDLLQFLVELGIGGVLLALFLWRIIRESTADLSRGTLSIGILVAFYSISASSLVNFPLRVAPNLFLFFLLAALVHRHRSSLAAVQLTIRAGRRLKLLTPVLTAVFLVPILFACRFFLGGLHLQKGMDALDAADKQKADRHLTAARALDASEPMSASATASLLLFKNDPGQALSVALSGVASRPTPRGYKILADAALAAGRKDIAEDALARRAYTFRSQPAFALDYLTHLFAAGRYGMVASEVLRLNQDVRSLKVIDLPAAAALRDANSLRLLALLLSGKTVTHSGFSGFTAAAAVKERIYLGSPTLGLWIFEPGRRTFTRVPGMPFTVVHALRWLDPYLLISTDTGVYTLALKKDAVPERLAIPLSRHAPVFAFRLYRKELWSISADTLYCSAFPPRPGVVPLRIIRTAGGEALHSLRSSAVGFDMLLAGGRGVLLNVGATNATLHSIQYQDNVTGQTIRPDIRSISFLNQHLALLATDRGLLTLFVSTGTVVRQQHQHLSLLDANFSGQVLILLTDNGRLIIQEMQEFLQGINKHDLSKASVTYTESTIRQQSLSNALATDSDSRIVIYSHPPFNNWVFAAAREGLLSQAGPYGSLDTLQPPGPELPGPGILASAAVGGTLYLFDRANLWRHDANGFTKLMALPAEGSRSAAGEHGSGCLFAAGRTLYRILPGSGPAQLLQLPAVPAALAIFSNHWAAGFGDGRLYLGRDGQLAATTTAPAPVTALSFAKDGLWVGTSGAGLFHMQTGGGTLRPVLDRSGGLPDNTITALSATPTGLAIGTARGGLSTYFPASGDLVLHIPHPWRDYTRAPVTFITRLGSVTAALAGPRIMLSAGTPGAYLPLEGTQLGIGIPSSLSLCNDNLVVSGESGVIILPGMLSLLESYQPYLGGR